MDGNNPGDKVPFKKDNVLRCLCAECPVQTKSQCAMEKSQKLGELIKNMDQYPPPKEEVPKEYCSIGKASCVDIDTNQICICPNCPVWEQYNLNSAKPTIYYCRDGKAE